ncbi:MAG TPA: VOC family protein [Polyangiaceae bacterium]|nr:VOC family protein [Polyangiaceae bacterium]
MLSVRICIDVDDLDRAIAFFTDGLGLQIGRRFDAQWVEVLGASSPIDLLANPSGSPAVEGSNLVRDYARHWTSVHLDFLVTDVEAAVKRAVAAGAVLERAIRDQPYGRIASLADPFGNGLCLIQMTERGYDALLA